MARSEAHAIEAAHPGLPGQADRGERRLRRIGAWLALFFLVQGELGAVWDREWHAFVGRDQFWTPPHTLIYSCIAGAGLVALTVVLLDTARYRRGVAGVDDSSTVPVFGLFHAPLGFVVAGFGGLLVLIAAPLDNYWHELYGIDVALWAPFHVMDIIGGVVGSLGMVQAFASEATIDRERGRAGWNFLGFSALELGVLTTLAGLLNFALTGFLQFPIASFGPLDVSTYPLPLAAGGAFCFIGALRFTCKPRAATFLVGLLLLHTLATELFVPWAVRTAVAQQGMVYRVPGHVPYFRWDYTLLPLLFLASALIVDGFYYWKMRRGSKPEHVLRGWRSVGLMGVIITPPALLIAPYILRTYSSYAPVFLPQPGLLMPTELWIEVVLFSVLVALLFGAAGAVAGAEFGDIWRWGTR
jgi:hypothetical protein